MTALVGEEVKATLSKVARGCRGHTVAALAQADDGEGKEPGGFVEPFGVAHQFGAQGIGAGCSGVIGDVSHGRNAIDTRSNNKQIPPLSALLRKHSDFLSSPPAGRYRQRAPAIEWAGGKNVVGACRVRILHFCPRSSASVTAKVMIQRDERQMLKAIALCGQIFMGLASLLIGSPASPVVAQFATADVAADMEKHLEALQAIADAHGGNRAAGTSGYRASVDYAAKVLEKAGYEVTRQRFEVTTYRLTERPVVALVRPEKERLRERKDYLVVNFSGSVVAQRPIVPAGGTIVPPPANGEGLTSGCAAGDFPAETRGAISLVQRGGCSFTQKFENAQRAGAKALLVFNSGLPSEKEVMQITAEDDNTMPIVFLSYRAGRDLFRSAEARRTVARVEIRSKVLTRPTWNLIADSRNGDPSRTLVVGGHLDSVPDGPGINDNGSGTALVLVAAQRMAERWERPRNRVRFALWAAEEMGLLGSNHYVTALSKRERRQIFAYLNFDMVASPNYVRFVDTTRGNAGSEAIGIQLAAAFERVGLRSDNFDSGGRTDTFAFIGAGIPAAGLFSGAEGEKTQAQQRRYGGLANRPYDACYHQPCDTIGNISHRALNEFSAAAFDVIRVMARKRPSVTASTAATPKAGSTTPLYRGPYALR